MYCIRKCFALLLTLHMVVEIGNCKKFNNFIHSYYDFETSEDFSEIIEGRQYIQKDNVIKKHGRHSLKWRPLRNNSYFSISIQSLMEKLQRKRKNACGVYFWLYLERPFQNDAFLNVNLYGATSFYTFSFIVQPSFAGWRAVVRRFPDEKAAKCFNRINFDLQYKQKQQQLKYSESDHTPQDQPLPIIRIDLLRLGQRCSIWSYDNLNPPPISQTALKPEFSSTTKFKSKRFNKIDYWQHVYKWRQLDIQETSKTNTHERFSPKEVHLLKDIDVIERRVDNWFYPLNTPIKSLEMVSSMHYDSMRDCKQRWLNESDKQKLKEWQHEQTFGNFPYRRFKYYKMDEYKKTCIHSAHSKYNVLENISSNIVDWPPLFASRDVFPIRDGKKSSTGYKFYEVTQHVLLPLAYEYYVLAESNDRRKPYQRKTEWEHTYEQGKEPAEETKARTKRILNLLRYMSIQGWDDGSGLSTSDHLLNLNCGFIQSVYMMRKTLLRIDHSLFERLLNATRWYVEIGENNKINPKHKGSTADKIRNGIPSRLLALLSTSGETQSQARRKINDMKNLKNFIENSLEINEGYGGLIKPDFTGFHHKGVYIARYITQAYHALSLVAFFLHNTTFSVSRKHLRNLKEALETIYVMTNNLELPYAMTGAKVSYANIHLAELVPAFAYLAMAMKSQDGEPDLELSEMFMYSYDTSNPYFNQYLTNGIFHNDGKFYFHTIGSSTIISKFYSRLLKKQLQNKSTKNKINYMATNLHNPETTTKTLNKRVSITKELRKMLHTSIGNNLQINNSKIALRLRQQKIAVRKRRSGHWCKNYAAFSIHRRDSWTVTVKGFSKYVWDYESYIDQNLFGMYQSHGHLQIVQSRKSLNSLNIFHGWNWNRFPGTTTIELSTDILRLNSRSRYFQNSTTVGGVVLEEKNGMFAMEFQHPDYDNVITRKKLKTFRFKKSFTFYDNMIICLGSEITKKGLENYPVSTTLFQTTILGSDTVYYNNKKISNEKLFNKTVPLNKPITFVDVNNNGYFIPSNYHTSAQLKIGTYKPALQPNGKSVKQPYIYTTLSLLHGDEPQGQNYEYAVLVNSGFKEIWKFKKIMWETRYKRKAQSERADGTPKIPYYKVLQQDGTAHVLKIIDLKNNRVVLAYTIFEEKTFKDTRRRRHCSIHKVSRPCIVMLTETTTQVKVAIVDPDLRMFNDYLPSSRFIRKNEIYHIHSKKAWTTVNLNAKNLKLVRIENERQDLRESVQYQEHDEHGSIKLLLSHGTTTELTFRKIGSS